MGERGNRMRAVRVRLGLTQDGMARKMCVTPSAVARWEQGNREPSHMALRLAELLEQQAEVEVYERPRTA